MTPADLGRELRQGRGGYLPARRAIVGLSLAAMGPLALISLYQIGLIPRLPDPPLPGFDADRVHGSAAAYALFATPDAFLGLGSYAATMALAMMGSQDRAATRPWLPVLLAGKTLLDVGLAGRLFANQVTKLRAFSVWSLLISAATLAAAPLSLPEASAALRRLHVEFVARRG